MANRPMTFKDWVASELARLEQRIDSANHSVLQDMLQVLRDEAKTQAKIDELTKQLEAANVKLLNATKL